MTQPAPAGSNRRQFLAASTTAAVAAAAVPSLSAGLYAGGSDLMKVGLVGCGGRGTGAASQALNADSGVELVAMADAFEDRLMNSRKTLQRQFNKDGESSRVNVLDDNCFTGFEAYKKVVDMADVVLLASTPQFRPRHLKAAVEAGKHVFCEKPVAVDGPGLRSVLESVEKARENKTSLVSGLCWRYHPAKQAVFEQIQKGLIGDIVSMQCSYMSNGVWDPRKTREECKTEMEYQLRNWYYYTWLSGDFNVEQHIHSLDKMLWAMGDKAPSTITGSGGRQVRTDPKYGNIYDHFNIVYEWENEVEVTNKKGETKMESRPGVKAFARCRHWKGCETDVSDFIVGTKGIAEVMKHRIFDLEGNEIWRYESDGTDGDMYQIEHDELFASIRGAHPINNGDYMCKSTMMAIMARQASYTGQEIKWDTIWNDETALGPDALAWGPYDAGSVPVPGNS